MLLLLLLDPPMKERLLLWFVFVLAVWSVGGKQSDPKDDEDENSYNVRSNKVDKHDEAATSRMLQLINKAAMEIIDAPDLSKVITVVYF